MKDSLHRPEELSMDVLTLTAKEEYDEDESVYLHEASKDTWTRLLFRTIQLQHEDSWRICVILCLIVSMLTTTIYIVFIRQPMDPSTLAITVLCDMVYATDYLMALSGYLIKRARIHMSKPPRSRFRLIVDFILLNIPSHIIRTFHNYNKDAELYLCLGYFFRLYHGHIFYKEKLNSAGINHGKYFLIQYIINLLLLHHGMACFTCVYGRKAGEKQLADPAFLYQASVYMGLITTTSCGFGDQLPETDSKIVVFMISMVVGFSLTTGIYIGPLTLEFVNKIKRRALLRIQITNIKQYLSRIGMDEARKKEINAYYNILWQEKNGVQLAHYLHILPFPLRSEICFDINILPLLGSLIFQKQPEPFLRAISYRMKHEFYQPDDIIFHQGVIKNKMIFVVMGVIEILSEEDNQSPVIAFRAGSCLSEASLVVTLPAKASVRAACYTELQVLERRDFLGIVELYPTIYKQITDDIFDRIRVASDIISKQKATQDEFTFSLFVSQYEARTPIKKLKDRLSGANKADTKYYDKCLSLYRLTSNTRSRKRNTLCLTDIWPWILHPNSGLALTWEFIVAITAMIVGFLYPYYVAFERAFPPGLQRASLFVDLIYIVDLYVKLTTAVIRDKRLLKTVGAIFDVRLQEFGFYLDLFSTLHLEMFSYALPKGPRRRYYQLFKLNRMVKFHRIPRLFTKLENKINWPILPVILFKYPIYLIYIPYWVGALFFIADCFTEICHDPSWYYNLFINNVQYAIESPCSEYKATVSYYFALSCLSTVGYGDITPKSEPDFYITYGSIMFGILLFGYCTAHLSAVITHRLRARSIFQSSMFSVKRFIKDKNISYSVRQRVENFFVLQWYYDEGLGLENKSLFYNASITIQREVYVKERMNVILQIPMFQGTNLDFVQLIVMGAIPLILPPNECISYHGVVVPEFYIIQEGYCQRSIVDPESQDRHDVKMLGPTEHFGAIAMLNNIPCIGTVVTLTHVKLLCITDQVFWAATSMFPQVHREIAEAVQEVFDRDVLMKTFHVEVQETNKTSYRRRDNVKNARKLEFKGSFVNVLKLCRERDEDYSKPFRKVGHWGWTKYVLMPICVLPYGLFIKIWVYFRLFVALLVAFVSPYQLILAPYAPMLDRCMIGADVVAYLDMYIMFFVGYYGKKNQLIVHPLRTANHYLGGRFIVDLMLCFPYEWLIKWSMPMHNEDHSPRAHLFAPHFLHCIVRMVKIFQIYRLPQALDYMKSDIRRYMGHWAEIFKFILMTLIIINLCSGLIISSSCEYYYFYDIPSRYVLYTDRGVFLDVPVMKSAELKLYTMVCLVDCWIDKSNFTHLDDPISIYLIGIYFSISTITGCGFGDITPQYLTRLYMSMIMIIGGTLFFGYVFARISSQKTTTYSALAQHHEMIVELTNFMRDHKVSKLLQQQIINYLEYGWKRTKGTDPQQILSNLHTALHEDAVLDIYEFLFKEVPLLEGSSRSFLGKLGKEVKERYYVRGEEIFRSEDVIEHVFFILRGKVEVVSTYNDMVAYMGAGGVFGNLTMEIRHKINATIVALTNVDVLLIKNTNFRALMKNFPELRASVEPTFAKKLDFIVPTTTMIDDEDEDDDDDGRFSKETSSLSSSTRKSSSARMSISTTTSLGRFAEHQSLYGLCLFFIPTKWCRVALLPDIPIFLILNFLCMILAYFNYFLVIYQFAFQYYQTWILGIAIILDVCFFLKNFLELHKAYENRYGDYVTNNRRILKRFFEKKRKRLLELLANLPLYYLAFLLPGDYALLVFSILRMITILRIFYVLDYYKEKSDKLLVNRLLLELSAISIGITIILHTVACGWYLIACPLGICREKQWLNSNQQTMPDLYNRSPIRIYLVCMYYVISIFTTTGIGDILPSNNLEVIFVILSLVAAKFLIGVFIADVMNVFSSESSSLDNYEYYIKELRDYLQNGNLSSYQMDKMWEYVKRFWTRSGGKQIPRLVSKLHYPFRCDLKMEIYGPNLRNSYLFNGTEEAFIRQVAEKLEHTVFFPGNYIVQHGDSNLSMYFIHVGEIDILTVHPNLTETVHEVLEAGDMFGLGQGLFTGLPHYFSYRAKTVVDIVRLRLPEWDHLMDMFPRSKELIYRRAYAVYEVV